MINKIVHCFKEYQNGSISQEVVITSYYNQD